MFISPAYAQGAAGGANDLITMLAPFLIVILIMYFLVIRPQQVRQNNHKAMIAALSRGDMVVTAGGLHAKVVKVVSDSVLQVEIAEGVRVKIERATVADKLTKESAKGS